MLCLLFLNLLHANFKLSENRRKSNVILVHLTNAATLPRLVLFESGANEDLYRRSTRLKVHKLIPSTYTERIAPQRAIPSFPSTSKRALSKFSPLIASHKAAIINLDYFNRNKLLIRPTMLYCYRFYLSSHSSRYSPVCFFRNSFVFQTNDTMRSLQCFVFR